jgi:endonuclease G, mitochondrial
MYKSCLLLLLLTACSPSVVTSLKPLDEVCGASVFVYGQPVSSAESTTFLCRTRYALLHSNKHKIPIYSAERLARADLDGPVRRTDDFRTDLDLPTASRSEPSDYRGSGYDRGHMSPSGDFSTNRSAMSESFLMSNMVPQNRPMNTGIWSQLEVATRSCARSAGVVHIITGPVIPTAPKTIGRNKVSIPSQIYKIVLDPATNQTRAYLIPNKAVPADNKFSPYSVSIDTVEQATGLDFFPQTTKVDEAKPGTLCTSAYNG